MKTNKKPIYLLLVFLAFFGLFIALLMRPSTQIKAIKELETCFSKKDVETVWYKYKADLYQDEDFLKVIRTKLSGLQLDEKQIAACNEWLPPAPTSINVIVIPDLSRRITDDVNNPHQIENDIFVLNAVWKSFVNFSKLKQDSKDRLIVDVTDIDQAKGQFGIVANNLQFDLSTHKGKSNRLFFTPDKDTLFSNSIKEMYDSAKDKPLGTDYRFYFRRYLAKHLKKSTFFDTYVNKVIIITDGYLEAENKPADTKIYGFQKQLYQSVTNGNILDVITTNGLAIPAVDIDLSNTEIMVCEMNERKTGKGFDFEILKTYWEDWLGRMAVKKIVIAQREQATSLTAKQVQEFIEK